MLFRVIRRRDPWLIMGDFPGRLVQRGLCPQHRRHQPPRSTPSDPLNSPCIRGLMLALTFLATNWSRFSNIIQCIPACQSCSRTGSRPVSLQDRYDLQLLPLSDRNHQSSLTFDEHFIGLWSTVVPTGSQAYATSPTVTIDCAQRPSAGLTCSALILGVNTMSQSSRVNAIRQPLELPFTVISWII